MGVVDDESAVLRGQRGQHRVQCQRRVLLSLGHHGRVGEAGSPHRFVQTGSQQGSRYAPVLQLDPNPDAPPAVDELGTEHALAVAARRLDHDDLVASAKVREAGPGDVVRWQAVHTRLSLSI